MTRMSAENRRGQLVDAAIQVMTREGVARATTRAIAAEAGTPLGNFHYAFHSKLELMAKVIEAIAQRSKAEMDRAVLGGEAEEVIDLVRGGMFAYFDHVVAHPREHLVTYEITTTALRDEELEEAAKRQYDYYLAETEALLAAGAELMGLEFTEPLPVISRLVFSLMDGLALNYLARGGEEEAREVVELAARLCLALARPARPADAAVEGQAS